MVSVSIIATAFHRCQHVLSRQICYRRIVYANELSQIFETHLFCDEGPLRAPSSQKLASLFSKLLLTFQLAQFDTADFTRNGLWQRLNKLNLAGILVGSRDPFDMLLDFAYQFGRGFIARSENDIGFHDLAAHLIGTGNDGRLGYGRMLLQGALYLKGAYAVTGADDDIIGTSDEPEVAIFVLVSTVSGDIPVTTNAGSSGIGIAPVFLEHPGWALRFDAHGNIAFFMRRQLTAIMINHAHIEAGRRSAHRTGLDC